MALLKRFIRLVLKYTTRCQILTYQNIFLKSIFFNRRGFLLSEIKRQMSELNGLDVKKHYEDLLEKDKKIDKELEFWEKKTTQSYEMNLLHKYNDIKDAAQVLLGAISNIEGVTFKELHQRFNLPLND